jgi:hypothetical protein
MAVLSGGRYTWSDTDNLVRDVSGTLNFLDPRDRVLLDLFGPLQKSVTSTKHEWLEKTLRPMDGTVANDSSFANTTDPVAFNVLAGQGKYLRIDDILLVGTEMVRVTGVSTDAITVTRGWASTTPASHAALTAWHLVAPMVEQDKAAGLARTLTRDPKYNYTQFYEADILETSTQREIQKYVDQNDFDIESADEIKNAWQTYDRSLLVGKRVAPVSGTPGAMDGLLNVISTNTYAKAGATLTEAMFLKALQDSWDAGGRVNKVVTGRFQKGIMNTFLDGQRLTTRTDRTGGSTIQQYEWDGGTVDIVMSRTVSTVRPDVVLFLETARLGFGPFSGHALSIAPRETNTRTTIANQIIGQYTCEIHNENAHASITGLATS